MWMSMCRNTCVSVCLSHGLRVYVCVHVGIYAHEARHPWSWAYCCESLDVGAETLTRVFC